MIKKKVFQDIPRYQINEDEVHFAQHEGRVIAKDHITKTVIFEKWNKVILPGSFYTLQKHWPGIKLPVKLPNYNEELDLDNSVALTPEEKLNKIVVLFAMGTDGCGPEGSQIYDVDYTKWIDKDHLVPFRYCISDNDLNDELRGQYFGRKELKELDRVAYFFKAFDAEPVVKCIYMDGTPVDENVYTSENKQKVRTYVELTMSVNKYDFRDYYEATTGINNCEVNTISLLTAYPKTIDGYTVYQDIQPLTKLNFSNESLRDLTKGIDITYQIYY